MPTQHKAYKFRLYPNKVQAELMAKTFGCCRLVYNTLLDYNMSGYKESKLSNVKWANQFNTTQLKQTYGFLGEVSATALQQAGRNLNAGYSNWFNSLSGKRKGKKLKPPKFKSKHSGKKSFSLTNQKFSVGSNSIRLEKMGWVNASIDRIIPVEAKILSITVSQNASGDYYGSVCVEEEVSLYKHNSEVVGLDVGIKSFVVLSNGVSLDNPKWFRENQAKLKRAQQHLSRKQRGSNHYKRQRVKVARIHQDIANKRSWFLHNVSAALVGHYGTIVVEDLNVAGMVKNHKLSKSILDASWSELFRQLDYKSRWRGRTFVKVDRFYPSSKTCSCCGEVNKDLTLSDRVWTCSGCGAIIDRDLNAAVNIHLKGCSDLSAESVEYRRGETVSPIKSNFDWHDSLKRSVESWLG